MLKINKGSGENYISAELINNQNINPINSTKNTRNY